MFWGSAHQVSDARHKARIVACGNFQQATGKETHATVASQEDWMTLIVPSKSHKEQAPTHKNMLDEALVQTLGLAAKLNQRV